MDVVKNDTCIFYIGCFYFTLGNMRPQLWSTIKAIQLIALAKTSHNYQYGISPILQCITDDILHLEKVHMNYIYVCINIIILQVVEL